MALHQSWRSFFSGVILKLKLNFKTEKENKNVSRETNGIKNVSRETNGIKNVSRETKRKRN
jgi:hypothetical protein